MSLQGNALVIQSGGPTAVINQSLAGVLSAARDYQNIQNVLGSVHGLHGLLHENFWNLSAYPAHVWQDISCSPGAALGSARLKPKESDLKRIFEVFNTHNIKFLFYIGGNDSAEAAQLIRAEANRKNYDVRILHIPKTIDNDLMVTDHCPGYGSVARVVSHIVAGDDLDNKSFYNGVKINIAMGRHAGWLAASTALARRGYLGLENPETIGPHLIYLPEIQFKEDKFLDDVQRCYDKIGRVTIVAAEGIADQIANNSFLGEKDEFGNAQLSGSSALGDYLSLLVKKHIKVKTDLGKLRVRADTWGYMQRSLPGMPSPTDQAEAFWAGSMAVRFMMDGETDKMVKFVRRPSPQMSDNNASQHHDYHCDIGLCDLTLVAQKTKVMPRSMINAEGNGVTEEFFEYAMPLASILPAVRTLNPIPVEKKLAAYIRN